SLRRVLAPVFWLSLLVSLAAIAFNETLVPWATERATRLRASILERLNLTEQQVLCLLPPSLCAGLETDTTTKPCQRGTSLGAVRVQLLRGVPTQADGATLQQSHPLQKTRLSGACCALAARSATSS
ncbi:MAG: LptF/LptG family permease, partial [Fimbriimonadales bacterium]|nr:LptF/LptG family permease [Fimbriimonadales bacterium]